MANLVAIVGRPNVGKSTLFNRLTKTRQAIVSDTAGTTRDRQYGKCEWNGREFSVVDTGGWVVNSDDIFEDAIRKQVIVATEEADVVLFVVDVQTGLTDWDQDVATILRRTKLPVILVANKTDNNDQIYDAAEFYALGLGEPQCISSATGSGTGDLLDLVLTKLKPEVKEDVEDGIPRFAVVGRPNAGKSSIINAFIGEDRNIVTEIAGTTRDSIYTRYDKFGFDFYLVDTAGIRRKNKVSEDLEFYSVMRSIRAIENSDVCILMLDAIRGIEAQDMNIFQLIQRNNKSLVVVVNKWDLVENKDQAVIKTFENAIRQRMAPFVDFPIIFASALTKQRIFKVLETAKEVYLNRKAHVGTSKLNEVMLPLIEAYPPPSTKGKYIKIKYCTQLPNTQIPSFVFYANLPQYIKEPYRRFLENKIRENWSMHGCPINIFIRQKSSEGVHQSMRHIIYLITILCCLALVSCGKQSAAVNPDEMASRAAKIYYDYLLHGDCAAYVDGFYRPDSIPESYREQLIVSAKQYVGQMKTDHQGLVSVEAAGARTDTAKHVGEAYLMLGFGDKTKEEIVVPLVLHNGNWMLR